MLFDSQSSNQLISLGADALNPSPLQGTAALSLSTVSSGLIDPLQQSSLRLGSSASTDSAIAPGISVVGGTPLAATNFAPALAPALAPPLQALEAAGTFEIHQNNNTGALSNQILGNTAGLSNFNIDYIGDARAIGTFEHDPFGLGSGIVLSTGKVEDLAGKNISDGGFSPGTSVSLQFTKLLGLVSAPGGILPTAVWVADLSKLGVDLRSLSIVDSNSKSGGGAGYFSGFDLDGIKLSHTLITSATQVEALPGLDVFDFSSAGTFLTPGTQRSPGPYKPDLSGTINGYVDNGLVRLDRFDGTGTGDFSLGDGGKVAFNLTNPVPTNEPLYLYIGENGDNGEVAAGNISVSNRPISGLNDLSTDFGAPGAKDDDIALKFSFDADATVQNLYFQFAFGSEELVEYAGSNFNDAFSLSLNGFNMAQLSDGAAVTINNLATNPFGPYHPDLIYNPVGKGPASDQTRLDGYTKILTFAAPLEANANNTLEIRVKDGRDGLLDSAVFIRTGTFGTIDPTLITVPVFRDDIFSTNEDTAITIAPTSLLLNDTGANGATLSVTGVNSTGTKGTVTFDGTGITYDPAQKFESLAQGETASDRFAYLLTDSNGGTGSANVTITITGVNDNPDAVDDTFATVDNIPLIITPSTLLRNDSDVDTSDVLTITTVGNPTHGTVKLDSVGNILFTPDSSFSSQASFSYTISDGKGGSDTATVTLSRCSCDDGSDTWNYIIGTPASDVLVGTDGRDYITALAGDDVLIGGKGADYQDGGDGVDSLSYTDSTVAVTVNLATATASGGDATGDTFINIERAFGSKYNDFLIGNSQDNLLDGGLGNDTMSGGLGDDIYDVNSPGDVVIENANQGTDYVSSSINYTLGDNLEYLYITGGATTGNGNSLNNVIYGNDLDNTLSGLDGNDYLYGIGGNDILDGGAGNDALDGGIGNDTMSGGLGNDSYDVDSPGDIVVELADQGIDGVSSSINYTLGDNLENLFLRGNAASGTGNSLNNQIYGNDVDSALFGLDGNDYLIGDGIGNHTMYGGIGDDTYYVDGSGDIVVELASQGMDGVNASINYTLGDNVENLYLSGSATTGIGNSLNNQIYGNNRDNILSGLDGDDNLIGLGGSNILDGGAGNDALFGGAGADKFRFHALSDGIDRIQDFQAIEGDQIEIVKSTFGASSISQFSYDATTGALYFDADPTDTIAPTQFAVLVNTPSDFSIALNITLI